jgi:glycogen debranching enzyme
VHHPSGVTIDPRDELLVGDQYDILSSSIAADLPKLVLKHDDAFLVADRRGDFPGVGEFGFYADGTRFLSQLELRVAARRPLLLNATITDDALQAVIELTNADVLEVERSAARRGQQRVVPGRALRMSRRLTVYRNQLYQIVTVESFAQETHELEFGWIFDADFIDVFEARGHRRAHRGVALPPVIETAALTLGYRGLDDVVRTSRLEFFPGPARIDATAARYVVTLPPGKRIELAVTITATVGSHAPHASLPWTDATTRRRDVVEELRRGAARFETDHSLFNSWGDRALSDLLMLLTDTPDGFIAYAGIPWYVAPFGRDSLITALQMLPFNPEIARGTLRFLGRHQGDRDDAFTDQEPGKILHEYRTGEMASCREIPFIPYFGTVDATPLYVMLLAEYVRWTGDVPLARELWPNVERALGWMAASGGCLTYSRRSPIGLDQQGWKDSHDAIMHASGTLAPSPIAVAEAQGYHYAALLGSADIAECLGQPERARGLRQEAERVRARFEADFWLPDADYYALALDGSGKPCRVISSNPGHCLWTGIVDDARAEAVVHRLMADDMYTGWGVRTLSSAARLYNPISYHNGSVWPHDTAIAAMGMLRYGFTDAFLTLATGLFHAVQNFDRTRMPELFCGFPRTVGLGPTRYPVACSPQAWSAGVVFQLVTGMLRLVPDAASNRVTLDRPCLPSWLKWIELRGLRVSKSRIDLRVTQRRENAAVELLARDGDAEIVVRR